MAEDTDRQLVARLEQELAPLRLRLRNVQAERDDLLLEVEHQQGRTLELEQRVEALERALQHAVTKHASAQKSRDHWEARAVGAELLLERVGARQPKKGAEAMRIWIITLLRRWRHAMQERRIARNRRRAVEEFVRTTNRGSRT